MTVAPAPFIERYAKALTGFLALPDEAGLGQAYELGREAIAQGLGVLELTTIHVSALKCGGDPSCADAKKSVVGEDPRTWQFFAEAMSPFEMALRGFREANLSLKESARTLEERVVARTGELNAAERALREQARVLRSVMDSISDGIAVADTSGKIVLFNKAAQHILGVEVADDLAGKAPSAFGFFRPDTSTPFLEDERPLVRAIKGEQTPAVPMFVRSPAIPAGVHLSVIGSPLCSEEGHVEGGVAVFRDVTESRRGEEALRKTEEQLRQSQKMDAIGRLAGGVAHDFNNILSVILSYGGMLLTDLKSGEPMREDIEEICKAGQRAAGLTRQLLMFSRQQVLEPKVLDLNEVLISIDNMLQRILGADVDLVSLPAKDLGRIRADRGSLEQVIMNLVVNARDAMPTGGQLTIETHDVVLDERYASEHPGAKPGPHVMLSVSDTGIGMDAATRSRIFEPFFTTKEMGKGTGLGLSTTLGIVQQSGGTVWVYSEPAQGTTFKVYLPRVDAAISPIPSLTQPGALRGRETILLVDDDDQVRLATRAILRRNGYHVLDAPNAGEALLISEKSTDPIHLLLTDVVMPQVSGPELARRLAAHRPDMKVLCMSGYTDDSIVRHGVLEAHIAYIQKPLTPQTVAIKVRAVLDGDDATQELAGRAAVHAR